MKYFLGFDVGTNSSKGTLIDESGTVLYSITVEHEFEIQDLDILNRMQRLSGGEMYVSLVNKS